MKKYTIIGGVNGTGKSSFTGVLKASVTDLGMIIDVDRITAQAGGNPLQGGKLALAKIRNCLEKGACFTQETTLSGSFVPKTARQAQERGYYIRLYYIGLDSADESLRRIKNRVARGGHDIPADRVIERFENRWASLAAVLPYCDEASFYDNDNGFRQVAIYRNGELLVLGGDSPKWISDLQLFLTERDNDPDAEKAPAH